MTGDEIRAALDLEPHPEEGGYFRETYRSSADIPGTRRNLSTAIYYLLTPGAAASSLSKVHYALALAGLVTLVPGIVLAITEQGEGLAKLGSVLTILSMLLFLVTLFRHGFGTRRT